MNRDDDFLGAFAVLQRDGRFLLTQNRRRIGGTPTDTWDLPGGEVEAGETLLEALARELDEETGLAIAAPPQFLFVQEGQRLVAGRRRHAWRSFFFSVPRWTGEERAGHEILALRWMTPAELQAELRAPYHDSFLRWLERGGTFFESVWRD